MAQSNLIIAIVRSCSPRARLVRRRLDEIAQRGPSISAIGAAWAAERRAVPASKPWALAA
jgi:hypothetical protein